MPRRSSESSGLIWDEVWELLEETTARFNVQIELTFVPPSERNSAQYHPMAILARVSTFGAKPRSVCQRKIFVSSVRGAATVVGAAHRALSEVYWFLEERETGAAQQARF